MTISVSWLQSSVIFFAACALWVQLKCPSFQILSQSSFQVIEKTCPLLKICPRKTVTVQFCAHYPIHTHCLWLTRSICGKKAHSLQQCNNTKQMPESEMYFGWWGTLTLLNDKIVKSRKECLSTQLSALSLLMKSRKWHHFGYFTKNTETPTNTFIHMLFFKCQQAFQVSSVVCNDYLLQKKNAILSAHIWTHWTAFMINDLRGFVK